MAKILFLFLCVLFSCQWGEEKKKAPPVATYDREAISSFCELAAQDEQVFKSFRSHPIFNLVQDNVTFEQGLACLKALRQKYPILLKSLNSLKTQDQIGSPHLYEYEEAESRSPSTLHNLYLAGKIEEALGPLTGKKVVQVGAGFGGLCQVIQQVYEGGQYTIIDTPAALQLTRRYLNECGIKGVELVAFSEVKQTLNADVVISDAAFFECSKKTQDLLFEKVLSKASSGFLVGKPLAKHVGVVAYSPKEIQKKLKKLDVKSSLISEENFPSLSSFNLFWKKSLVCAENVAQSLDAESDLQSD